MTTDLYTLRNYTFGRDRPVGIAQIDRGDRAIQTQDVPVPNGLGIMFGRDSEGAPEWVFRLKVRGSDEPAVLTALGTLRAAWETVDEPGVTVPLVYELAGRTRRVVGRPRRFHEVSNPALRSAGLADVTASFQLADPRSFDDVESQVVLTLIPESTGGLISPLVAPLTTVVRGGQRAGIVTNSGDAPAPVTATFYGPVSNPRVFGDGWEIGLTGNLAWDESVTVDALAMTVTRQDGAGVGGRLTRGTRLRAAALRPGQQEISFTGGDATGTARAVVAWRPAHWSL